MVSILTTVVQGLETNASRGSSSSPNLVEGDEWKDLTGFDRRAQLVASKSEKLWKVESGWCVGDCVEGLSPKDDGWSSPSGKIC